MKQKALAKQETKIELKEMPNWMSSVEIGRVVEPTL